MNEFIRFAAENPIVAVIAGAEVGFWVVLAAGLLARYVLRLRTLGTVLLLCVPLLDVVLLVAVIIDLRGGATATAAHGLAASYLGFSVAFGHSLIRWADQRFAHRFAGGPEPTKPPRYGAAKVRHEWREWGKYALAWAIACGFMLLAIALAGAPDRTAQLWDWINKLSLVLVIWFVGWPLRVTVFPPREPASVKGESRGAES